MSVGVIAESRDDHAMQGERYVQTNVSGIRVLCFPSGGTKAAPKPFHSAPSHTAELNFRLALWDALSRIKK